MNFKVLKIIKFKEPKTALHTLWYKFTLTLFMSSSFVILHTDVSRQDH